MADPKESRTTLFTPETGCGISPDYAQGIINRVDALGANASRANQLNPDESKEKAARTLHHCSGTIEHAIHQELDNDVRARPTL